MPGKLFVISAPSGTGKTTLVNALIAEWIGDHCLKRVLTYTTRSPRANEVEGKDYYFISRAEFQKKIEEGFFLEWVDFCGERYGSPRYVLDPVYRGEDSYILVIDHTGGVTIKDIPGVVLIWIAPPSLNELRARLQKRGKDSPERIEERIKKAQEELATEDREQAYPYHLVNDDFATTKAELKSLISEEIESLNKPAK